VTKGIFAVLYVSIMGLTRFYKNDSFFTFILDNGENRKQTPTGDRPRLEGMYPQKCPRWWAFTNTHTHTHTNTHTHTHTHTQYTIIAKLTATVLYSIRSWYMHMIHVYRPSAYSAQHINIRAVKLTH